MYIENEWKEIIRTGNELPPETKELAIQSYRSTLRKAKELIALLNQCIAYKIPVMPIFLISCNNLAGTYCKLEK